MKTFVWFLCMINTERLVPSHSTLSAISAQMPALDFDASDSGSSSSNSSEESGYACKCSNDSKVSLLGAADYCLLPGATTSYKCGNVNRKERGECPRTGAKPCQSTGIQLLNDSLCVLDSRDNTYKCVASKTDLQTFRLKKQSQKSSGSFKDSSTSSSGDISSGNIAYASVYVMHIIFSIAFALVC